MGSEDRALELLGKRRNVVLTVQDFLSVAGIAAQTDLVGALPPVVRPLGRRPAWSCMCISNPFEVVPEVLYLYWHQRRHGRRRASLDARACAGASRARWTTSGTRCGWREEERARRRSEAGPGVPPDKHGSRQRRQQRDFHPTTPSLGRELPRSSERRCAASGRHHQPKTGRRLEPGKGVPIGKRKSCHRRRRSKPGREVEKVKLQHPWQATTRPGRHPRAC